jgi:hypothetical protein
MSNKMRSGILEVAIRNASSPSLAVTTLYPALDKAFSVAMRTNLLSSTNRINFKRTPSPFVRTPAAKPSPIID